MEVQCGLDVEETPGLPSLENSAFFMGVATLLLMLLKQWSKPYVSSMGTDSRRFIATSRRPYTKNLGFEDEFIRLS